METILVVSAAILAVGLIVHLIRLSAEMKDDTNGVSAPAPVK
jgi:hypothetical protein